MTVIELYNKISEFCPKTLSCSWDNDGIMVSPDLNAQVKRVLIALDASENVVKYAADNGFDTVLTHHPMLFRGAKSVSEKNLSGRRIILGIKNGVSVLSFHTRLDACDGGVNDALCRALGFDPTEKFGDEESPALGRIAEISPITAEELAKNVKAKLGCGAVRLTGKGEKIVSRIGICGGDGKDFIYPALENDCDAFITGDAGYNMAEDAAEDGIITIEAGHYHTEAPVLGVLEKLARDFTDAECKQYCSCAYKII